MRVAIMPASWLIAVLVLFTTSLAHVAAADPIDDYLLHEQAVRQIPGLAMAIVRQGRVERVSTYGMANLETNTPVTPDSVFAIASLDKGITATGVLKAMELGKLSLSDPVSRYVDVPLPDVTLAMLLGHTSGLEDVDQMLAEHDGSRTYRAYTTDALLEAVRGATRDVPGRQYHYSDAGPFLAQLATERVARKPWFEWMNETLFRPTGMLHVVTLAPQAIVAHRVASYTFDEA